MRHWIPPILAILALPLNAQNAFVKQNLVADQTGVAPVTDPGLVNAWGIALSPTGPFWLSATGSGLSPVYGGRINVANTSTRVNVPPAGSAKSGTPTGIVYAPTGFAIQGRNSTYLYASLDGTISGYNSGNDATHALVAVDNSASGAVYTGLAINPTPANDPHLFAANFHSGQIEVYDTSFNRLPTFGAFIDFLIPQNFAPFNVWNVAGRLYVTYAQRSPDGSTWVSGPGAGYVNCFDLNGILLQRLIHGGVLNAPWGVALAPPAFGPFAGNLLIGNYGDGRINVFDFNKRSFIANLKDTAGSDIAIPGLWALLPGNNGTGGDNQAVYFAAGPGGAHGIFGYLQGAPAINPAGVLNAGSATPNASPNTVVTIYGGNLAASARGWATADFKNNALPTSLDGVSVTVDGKSAYVSYVNPSQVNFLVPADANMGPVPVVVSRNGMVSTASTINLAPVAPSFFFFKNTAIAALHSDNKTPVGATNLVAGAKPAKPGETIVLYGTGFGPTNPSYPEGQLISKAYPLAAPPVVTVGGLPAAVTFAGLTAAGLYQINLTVPPTAPNGDLAVVAQVGGQANLTPAIVTVSQ